MLRHCALPFCDPLTFSGGGFNALHACAEQGDAELFELMLQRVGEADVHLLTKVHQSDPTFARAQTPLHFACWSGSEAIMRTLLSRGAPHRALRDTEQQTPLHLAALRHHAGCVALLLEGGGYSPDDLEAETGKGGFTALHCALKTDPSESTTAERQISTIQALLAAGANPNARCKLGQTPLMTGIGARNLVGAREMLRHSDLSAVDKTGATALHLACAVGLHQIVEELLALGAERMARDCKGLTPLHHASLNGFFACVALMLSVLTAAEVNAAAKDGSTALHLAAMSGSEKVCGALIAAGAQLDSKFLGDATSLLVAQEENSDNKALLALLAGEGPAKLPGTVCDRCAEPASAVFCSACGGAVYCGVACMEAAQAEHKEVCELRQATLGGGIRLGKVAVAAER
jgi:ankyrin repeat protein